MDIFSHIAACDVSVSVSRYSKPTDGENKFMRLRLCIIVIAAHNRILSKGTQF